MSTFKTFMQSQVVPKQAFIDETVIGTPYIINRFWSMIRDGSTKKIVESFEKGQLDCRQIIVEPSGHTVLHQAIILDRRQLFRLCEAFGTDYDKPDHNGVTALMKSAALGRNYFLKELLAHGANKELKDKKGRTALDYAYYYDQDVCITALKGGDIRMSTLLAPQDDNEADADDE